MRICHNCGHKWQEDFKPSYGSTCDHCGYDIHCCKNCRFYDPSRYNNCSEPMAERVPDIEAKNFCSYFEFAETEKKIEKSKFTRNDFDNLFN